MTGLIWKDFYVMRKAVTSYLVVLVIYGVLAYLELFNFGFIITFLQVMLMVLPMSAFAYDAQAKWDRYAMSLPLGRKSVVGARYLFVLALALITAAMGLAASAFLWQIHADDIVELVLTLLVASFLGLFVSAVLLPLNYKLGAERARPFLYAIIFIPMIAIVLLAKANILDLSALSWLNDLPPATLIGGASLLPLAGLVLLLLSYLISCRVAAGKEY